MLIKRGPKAGGMSAEDALALKTDIEAKGGTVTMAGDAPTVLELQVGIASISTSQLPSYTIATAIT